MTRQLHSTVRSLLLTASLLIGACRAGTVVSATSMAETSSTMQTMSAATGSDLTEGQVPAGRGAQVPWVELQAEDAVTNATVLGPSRQKWDASHIEAEAVGRRAVRLDKTGDYVEFTTTQACNAMVVRFAIPDAPGGGGINATLSLYLDGAKRTALALTSHYAWSYLGGLIGSGDTNLPAASPHTFFDEARIGPASTPSLGDLPAGTKVRLQRDKEDSAPYYVIDFIDLEQVAPAIEIPDGFTSVETFGVKANDGKDHADDIQRALAATSKLYFPPGEYLATSLTGSNAGNVGLNNAGTDVRGAGMWYTTLRGPKAMFFCTVNAPCNYSDFAVLGESTARDEETRGVQKAFAGPLGKGSTLKNLWIEHEVSAIWVGNDPPYQTTPTQNLHVHDVRIRNTYADGINLDNGTSYALVENVALRNTGDDAAVVWSIQWSRWVKTQTFVSGPAAIKPEAQSAPDQGVGHDNIFRHITVQMPWRANCFAAYGGYNNLFEDCLCEDVLTYPGILVDNEFSSYPFGRANVPAPPTGQALTTFRNISLIRAGGAMFLEDTPSPLLHGALKLFMREGDINDVLLENIDIVSPTYYGIEFRGYGPSYVPAGEKAEPSNLTAAAAAKYTNVTLRNVRVQNAGTYGVAVLDGASRGQVTLDSVTVSGSQTGAFVGDTLPPAFFVKTGATAGF